MSQLEVLVNAKRVMVLSKNNPLQIQVAKHDQWETKQPQIGEGIVPSVPCRIILSAPSNSGKTVLLVDLLTRIYAGCFERIFVFSPSVHLDSAWVPVKEYSTKVLGILPEEETFFDYWDEEKVSEILSTQRAVVKHQKEARIRRYSRSWWSWTISQTTNGSWRVVLDPVVLP